MRRAWSAGLAVALCATACGSSGGTVPGADAVDPGPARDGIDAAADPAPEGSRDGEPDGAAEAAEDPGADATGEIASEIPADGMGADAFPPPEIRGPDPSGGPFVWTDFLSPPVTARPWVRWWWPGNDVDDTELAREVKLLADNGFGGSEIQAFNAALDPNAPADEMARRLSWDTDGFYANVRTALDAAAANGLQLDLTLGSGWPSGGMHIAEADSMKTLLFGDNRVTGGTTVTWTPAGPDKPTFYTIADLAVTTGEPLARWMPQDAQLVAVVAAKVLAWGRDDSQLDITDVVTLDPATVTVLTDHVANGTLTWDAPAGDWDLVSFWVQPDGEYVNLSAQAGDGFVVDHFDAARFTANLEHLLGDRTGLAPYFGTTLRAFFNDSLEFKTERHFTDDFLAQFAARRGYDVTPFLPAVVSPGADDTIFDGAAITASCPFLLDADGDARVRNDWQQTVSDLFVERFVGTCTTWAAAHGLKARHQVYGARVDVIRASGAADLPEAEQLYAGGLDAFVKLVTSGAHLYGRNRVSAESLVWAGRDYMTTPAKAKLAADKLFADGVNHLIYHGFPYRKTTGYGETGWDAFCSPFSGSGSYSSNLGEGDAFWPFWTDVNAYVSRVQAAMRAGRPEADLLVYYPWIGVSAGLARQAFDETLFLGQLPTEPVPGESLLFKLVDGFFGQVTPWEGSAWLAARRPTLAALEAGGWTWDWINDDRLAAAVPAAGGGIDVGPQHYRGVLVPDVPWMQPAAAANLATLAAAGVPVVVQGTAPARQAGYGGKAAGDAAVAGAFAAVATGAHAQAVADAAGDAGVVAAVAATGAAPAVAFTASDAPVRQARRLLDDGSRVIFLWNPGATDATVSVAIEGGCPTAWRVDAWNMTADALAVGDGTIPVPLAIPAQASLLVLCGVDAPPASVPPSIPAAYASASLTTTSIPVTGWTLSVTGADVTGGSVTVPAEALGDWRAIPALQWSASPGTYAAPVPAVSVPGTIVRAWLDLGAVQGAAAVTFAGADAGVALAPPFRVDVTTQVLAGAAGQPVTIAFTPPLRNGLLALGDSGDPQYVEFKGEPDTSIPAGIEGPVTLTVQTAK